MESIIGSWKDYRRALREKDRRLFDEVVIKARQHASAASFCAHLDPVEMALLSVLLEMQREIGELKERLAALLGGTGIKDAHEEKALSSISMNGVGAPIHPKPGLLHQPNPGSKGE